MNSTSDPGTAPARVLVTKIGLDGHDRGSRLVATYLRDAGMEVIFTGPWQPIAAVVALVQEEDVDVIGISSLATDHLIVPRLMEALRDAGLGHVGVVVGGIVPDAEVPLLTAAGVHTVFHPGSNREEIVDAVRRLAAAARGTRLEFELPGETEADQPAAGAAAPRERSR